MIDTPPLIEAALSASAALFALVLALIDVRFRRHLLLLWAVAATVVLVGRGTPVMVLAAVAVAAASTAVADRRARAATLAVGTIGAVLVWTRDLQFELVAGALVGAMTAAALLWRLHRAYGQPVVLVLAAGTAAGIYGNVPDTEEITVVAGGLGLLAVGLVVVARLRSIEADVVALALVAVLVLGAGALGARGRPDAFVGVIGSLGVIIVEPVVHALRRGRPAHPLVLVVAHAGVVWIASRVAGTREAVDAIRLVAPTLGLLALVLLVVPRSRAVSAAG